MLKPRALRTGDRVAVVAPASPFQRDEFEAGLAEIRRLGFEPAYDESLFERRAYLAGSARTRAGALRRALADPSVRAVLSVRGGYGSVQVLPFLDVDEIRTARKPIVGYSDLTSLLAFVSCNCGMVSMHGPTVAGRLDRGADGYDKRSFLGAVASLDPIGELTASDLEAVKPGEAGGALYGGNLTQLCASLGTPYAFDPPAGCILFLEDVNERPYRLDRLWTQLRLAGILGRATAIVFGTFPGCDEPGDSSLTGRSVLADLASEFPGPVLFGLPSGHTAGPALTLPFGVSARVVAGPHSVVAITEAAVTD
ncbi:MAG TPA: LD-carboxypeptidase [Vicinamibacterales bacterium]|jgi:muramoyltetrapeptide carboxypeptidase